MLTHLKDLEDHYRAFFHDREPTVCRWEGSKIAEVAPGFRVLAFPPSTDDPIWTYVSVGASCLNERGGWGMEFFVHAHESDGGLVELLAMTSFYSRTAVFDVGHTVPIGWPWRQGSAADHLLISLPYTLGEEIEISCLAGRHVRTLWLLPVHQSEVAFRHEHGLDALEERFEQAGIEFWDPAREPVV